MTLLEKMSAAYPDNEALHVEIPDASVPSYLQVYAALFAMNGFTPQVEGWGMLTGGGLYGWQGLEQDQALRLLNFDGFVAGWLAARPEDAEPFRQAVVDEWDRVAALRGISVKGGGWVAALRGISMKGGG